MKINKVYLWAAMAVFIIVACITLAVSSEISATVESINAEFTDQTPKAIIQGAWIIFAGIMFNAFMR